MTTVVKVNEQQQFKITFAGFLAVRLMQFEYAGKKFSYRGRKLENAVRRLMAKGGPKKATTEELVEWGSAYYDWNAKEKQCPKKS